MARASATRWRWPPESWPGLRSSSAPRPRVSAARLTLVARSSLIDAALAQRELDVLGHGQVRVQRVALEDHGHVAVLGVDVVDHAVADGDGAVVDLLEPGDEAQRRRLAAARRAEQHEQLAVGDVQRQVVDSGGVAEPLGDALEADLCQRAPFGGPSPAADIGLPHGSELPGGRHAQNGGDGLSWSAGRDLPPHRLGDLLAGGAKAVARRVAARDPFLAAERPHRGPVDDALHHARARRDELALPLGV